MAKSNVIMLQKCQLLYVCDKICSVCSTRSVRGLMYREILHEVGPEAVDEGAQRQAALPGGSEVTHVHVPVALRLLLTPGQQPAGSNLRLWGGEAG